MNNYNFIVYQNETGVVQQVTSTPCSNLPVIPEEDGVTAVHVGFFNDITDTFYDPATGKFYEDAEKTVEITDPAFYVKPMKPTAETKEETTEDEEQ